MLDYRLYPCHFVIGRDAGRQISISILLYLVSYIDIIFVQGFDLVYSKTVGHFAHAFLY